MNHPLITAIVSTYRAERFMRGCLEDLVAQTLGDRVEILVIDSNSPENEGDIVREFQQQHPNIRYVRTSMREETTGAFNRAIGLARGKYLTTANTDDRHRPDALELMTRALEEHPEFGIVYADSLITNQPNERFGDTTARLRYDWPDYTHATGLSCCLFGAQPVWRRDVHKTVGMFHPNHLIANDQDMFLRIAWRFGAVHLRETLGLFLQRPDSNSGADYRSETIDDVMSVMKKYRLEMPLQDVFPALRKFSNDPMARAAALFELGNLCALGPYNDLRLAIDCYQEAVEHPLVADRVRSAYANNVAGVLACFGLYDRALHALDLSVDTPESRHNRATIRAAAHGPGLPVSGQFRFVSVPHQVITESRTTRGLQLFRTGELVWSEPHEQLPWDVFDGPNGVPVHPSEREWLQPMRPRRELDGTQHVMLVMYGWEDSGGGTMLPRQVAYEFVRRGLQVTVFYAAAQEDPEVGPYAVQYERDRGVDLYGVFNRPALFMDLEDPSREADDPRLRSEFQRLVHELRPDVVHFFNLHNLGLSLPSVAKRAGIPTVFSSNNYWPVCPRLYLIDEQIRRCPGASHEEADCESCTRVPGTRSAHEERTHDARTMLNEALDAHLAVSHRVRELYLANGAAPDRIEVLHQQPHGVDELWHDVGSQRAIVEVLERPLRVGFIGSAMPHKGVHVLATALQALPAGSVACTIHGDCALDYAHAVLQIDRNECIEFAGTYEPGELAERLRDVDVVVVPSIWEDCAPFVTAEALAARCPVIGSRIGGIPDFIDAGRTGMLFEAGDAQGLAECLAEILRDPGLLGRMQAAIEPPRGFGAYVDDLESVYARVRQTEQVLVPAVV